MTAPVFSYPHNDEDCYLSFYKEDFSSVFVATNPFLKIEGFSPNITSDWIPDEVSAIAKTRDNGIGVSWQEIAKLCGFSSIAQVNRALRRTGSARLLDELACPADTQKMLEACRRHNIFVPDEGFLSPLSELALAKFLEALGQDNVVVAQHFGTAPDALKSQEFLQPKLLSMPEIHTSDRSLFVSMYIDCHYFLICQSGVSRLTANPNEYFEGFFADEVTTDFWGIGSID